MNKNRRRVNGGRTSSCGDLLIRGTPEQLVIKYEGLALEAAGGRDDVTEQTFLQQAEHYRRVGKQNEQTRA